MTDITNRSTHSLLLISDIAPGAISTECFRQPLIIDWSCWHSLWNFFFFFCHPALVYSDAYMQVCSLTDALRNTSFFSELYSWVLSVIPSRLKYMSMSRDAYRWRPLHVSTDRCDSDPQTWVPFRWIAEWSWVSHSSSLGTFDIFFFSRVVC